MVNGNSNKNRYQPITNINVIRCLLESKFEFAAVMMDIIVIHRSELLNLLPIVIDVVKLSPVGVRAKLNTVNTMKLQLLR